MWDLRNQLLALVVDRLAVSNFLQGQALQARGAYKKNPIPMPEPIPRPGVSAEAEGAPKKGRGMKALLRTIDPAKAAKAGI